MGVSQLHLAFYLPQFHPIPENDSWWGPGFTEWTKVAPSRPRFRGHYQPHIPADLGFYDLRLPETRQAQADLALGHGIDAFCYYHYWFGGRRLLERPFDEVLRTGEPTMPFALCWANESWTRSWDGRTGSTLIEQTYDDEAAHARWLVEAFADDRYVRVGGKSLFLVYRAARLPDARRVTDLWRVTAERAGVGELFLCRVESFLDERDDPATLGFDAAVEFAPDWKVLPSNPASNLTGRVVGALRGRKGGPRVIQYDEVIRRMLAKTRPDYLRFPCVNPGWDNSPRRAQGPVVLHHATPEAYERWVREASRMAPETADGDSLVFVNAWNEWGEGAHLEPDLRWGRSFLEAHRDGRFGGPPDGFGS
jgi:lipopolysaccharide biosynthesis protein